MQPRARISENKDRTRLRACHTCIWKLILGSTLELEPGPITVVPLLQPCFFPR